MKYIFLIPVIFLYGCFTSTSDSELGVQLDSLQGQWLSNCSHSGTTERSRATKFIRYQYDISGTTYQQTSIMYSDDKCEKEVSKHLAFKGELVPVKDVIAKDEKSASIYRLEDYISDFVKIQELGEIELTFRISGEKLYSGGNYAGQYLVFEDIPYERFSIAE